MESSATIRLPRRAVSAPMSEKARARMIRQEILEHEQHVEDLEALRITPVRVCIPLSSWVNVGLAAG